MYDQVKIDKVKAKITSLQYPKKSNDEIHNNISVVTAFDRNGLDNIQITEFSNLSYKGNNWKGVGTAIGKNISTYSSALTRNLSFGSTFEVTRYITPFTVQEKSQYISTDSLKQWYYEYDQNTNKYAIQKVDDNSDTAYRFAVNAVSKNPCYLERNEAIPFKPTYLIGVIGLDELSGNCIFNVELDVCCTFRGLRKSSQM